MIGDKSRQTRTPKTVQRKRRERERLLTQLICEADASGKPIYYKGFHEVLNGTVEPTAIVGASALQSYLVNVLLEFLYTHPSRKKFVYLSSEIGVQIAHKKWRSCDIAIYHRERLKDFAYTNKYIALAPDYVIEIDKY